MASKKKKSTKVDKNMAWVIIALTVVLGVLLVAMLTLGKLPGNNAQETTGAAIQPSGGSQQTQSGQETTSSDYQVIVQTDGTYEQWLAAGMVLVIPLEYPDFDQLEIYAAGETALDDKSQSSGVYVRFSSGGQQVILHSVPLEEERSEAATRDLSTMQIGFATLDAVSGEGVDFASMKQYTMEELDEYLRQTVLPSLYPH